APSVSPSAPWRRPPRRGPRSGPGRRDRRRRAFPGDRVRFAVTLGSDTLAVEVETQGDRHRVRLGEEWVDVDACWSASGSVSLLVDGAAYLADVGEADGEIVVSLGFHVYRMRVEEPGRRLGRRGGGRARGRPR